jgi:hypothetical protein
MGGPRRRSGFLIWMRVLSLIMVLAARLGSSTLGGYRRRVATVGAWDMSFG